MPEVYYDRISDEQIEEEAPFLLSWDFDLNPLKTSIYRIGQVSPLVVKPHQDGFKLICGYRRRQAMRELKCDEFAVLVLPESFTLAQSLVLAFEENLGHRTFNDAEKVLALRHLSAFFPVEELVRYYLPRLALPPKQEYLNRFLGLAALGDQGLTALARGTLDPETAELLLVMEPASRSALLALVDQLNPSRNKRRQIITWLYEISIRENRSVDKVIKDQEIQDVIGNNDLSRSDKEKKVRAIIHAKRYPELSRAQKKQEELIARLKLPANVRFQPPPSFEGLDFTFHISFQNLNELITSLESLNQLSSSREITDLLELG
ncbi:MAG: ParB N-terminal domain-containing protein [Deltaproteobacteria bacterium]|nr:ParB N-terminal domain-containing protein [Deltaproteobacteria bacterium]